MKVTVGDLIEASEKNGFPWARQETHEFVSVKLSSGGTDSVFSCVVGQGILNLGGSDFPTNDEKLNDSLREIFDEIYIYNDKTASSYKQAHKYMKTRLAKYLNKKIYIGRKAKVVQPQTIK